MTIADESLILSSSVFKAKVPYWKRRLQKDWFCRYSSRRQYYYSAMERYHSILRPTPWSLLTAAHLKMVLMVCPPKGPALPLKLQGLGSIPHKITQGWSSQNCSMSMTSFVFSPRVLLLQLSLPAAHHQLFFSPLAPAVLSWRQTLFAWYNYYQILTPPLSGMAEHTLRWCNEGHAASGPQHTPTLWQQPQTGACLSSDEGVISILVSSIILSLMEMKNMPFVHQTKASDKMRLLPQLF